MTLLDLPPLPPHHLSASLKVVRHTLPMAGCGLPAAALRDAAVARWVRGHGVTVHVCGADELALAAQTGVPSRQLLLRCGPVTETIRRGVATGVGRFIVSTDRHVDVIASCCGEVGATAHLLLDEHGPVVVGEKRVEVVGIHCDVDDSAGALEWGVAAERLLCRMKLMRTCGLDLTRISLAGGFAASWLHGDGSELAALAAAVDEALDDGCARWRLPRPGIALAPLSA